MNKNNNETAVQAKNETSPLKTPAVSLRKYLPVTDMVETDKDLVLYMDMPGVDKDAITVQLEKNVLRIDGSVQLETSAEQKRIYREYNVGNYARQFELSNKIDQSKIEATMEDGVLSLVLPKVPEVQPRSIQIN